jgi:hypothetical protein
LPNSWHIRMPRDGSGDAKYSEGQTVIGHITRPRRRLGCILSTEALGIYNNNNNSLKVTDAALFGAGSPMKDPECHKTCPTNPDEQHDSPSPTDPKSRKTCPPQKDGDHAQQDGAHAQKDGDPARGLGADPECRKTCPQDNGVPTQQQTPGPSHGYSTRSTTKARPVPQTSKLSDLTLLSDQASLKTAGSPTAKLPNGLTPADSDKVRGQPNHAPLKGVSPSTVHRIPLLVPADAKDARMIASTPSGSDPDEGEGDSTRRTRPRKAVCYRDKRVYLPKRKRGVSLNTLSSILNILSNLQ